MKKITKPKFEKVDGNTIRIIVENAQDIPLYKIVANRKAVAEQKEQLELTLKNIDEILVNAKKLGVVAKPIEPKAPAIRKIREGEESKE